MRMWVRSLVSLSGLRICCCTSSGVVHRRGSDLLWLWLWLWPAAAAPIWPLAWERPYAMGVALKKKKDIMHVNALWMLECWTHTKVFHVYAKGTWYSLSRGIAFSFMALSPGVWNLSITRVTRNMCENRSQGPLAWIPDSVALGWSLRFCVSNTFPVMRMLVPTVTMTAFNLLEGLYLSL